MAPYAPPSRPLDISAFRPELAAVRYLDPKNDLVSYHHYAIVEVERTHQRIEGLEFVFVELPKFRPEALTSDRMRKLWLRFLTETGGEGPAAAELSEAPETREALECVAESGFSREELDAYDCYWDSIRCEMTLVEEAFDKGVQQGMAEGMEQGFGKGIEQAKLEMAAALKREGRPYS